MCLLKRGDETHRHSLPVSYFEQLASDVFASLDTLVLFGWGEPLLHPACIDMLRIARKRLSPDATIKITSNGSSLTESIVDTILREHLVDHFNVSCDALPGSTAVFPGHHDKAGLVLEHIDAMLCHPLRRRMRISIETVAMQSNIQDLPKLVEQFGRRGVDGVFITHVFPYHPELESETLYTLMSSEAYSVLTQLGDIGPAELFGLPNRTNAAPATDMTSACSPAQAAILEQARNNGIKLNYALFQKIKRRISTLENTLAVFSQTRRNAQRHGMHLDLPPLFGSLTTRACPFVQAHAAVVRADGAVVPCFKNLYPHNVYCNGRTRSYTPHVFGSIAHTPFAAIWGSPAYRQFRDEMADMNKNIAWCGDCSFYLYYCYFFEEAQHDCMLNEPFCADCPFSLGLTRCVI